MWTIGFNFFQFHRFYQNEVSLSAYLDWLQAGCPNGRDEEFWFGAEIKVKKELGLN